MSSQQDFIINWSGRSFNYTAEEIKTVIDVMKKGDPLTQGIYLGEFERAFCDYTKARNAFAVSNCTNALDLASILCGLGKGDEVIIPAHTFCASAIPFGRTGAKIIWCDIDPNTRVASAESIENNITENTKAIVVVHLYGLMADMDPIMNIAESNNCYVIEDCAQSIGALYKGKQAGTIGDFGAFSFHGQKNLTTMGEGGMLTVKNDDVSKLVPGIRHNGSRPFNIERDDYWIPAMSNVDLDLEGVWPYNFCLSEAQCALGSKILERLDEMNSFRIERAKKFIDALYNYPELSFQYASKNHKHVYHLLSAQYSGEKTGKTNHDFIRLMAYKYKIKCIVQYYPLYRYPLFQKMGFGNHNCPNTDQFYDNMISFPFHIWMSDEQFDYMIDSTIKTLNELRK